jgi:hypothetical protein
MLSGLAVFLYLPTVTCFPPDTSQIFPIVMIMCSELHDSLNTCDNDWLTTRILQQTLSTVYSIGLLEIHTTLQAGPSSIIRDKHNYKHYLTGSLTISIPRWPKKEHFLVVRTYQSTLQKSKDLIDRMVEAWNHATILSDEGSRDSSRKAMYMKYVSDRQYTVSNIICCILLHLHPLYSLTVLIVVCI